MNYSNEDFERFQDVIRQAHGEDSLHWKLRDSIFAEVYYGKDRKFQALYRFPCGWLLVLGLLYVIAKCRTAAKGPKKPKSTATHHFLFLSGRSNHLQRLLPLFRETKSHHSCNVWGVDKDLWGNLSGDELADLHDISAEWCKHLSFRKISAARRFTRDFYSLFPTELDRGGRNAITLFHLLFYSWVDFWRAQMNDEMQFAISTFEKAAHVKAFYFVACDRQIPQRIHWIHGLRHASIQSTLATELWCMTPGDVRFFKDRVPSFCQPKVKKNPEAEALAAIIGTIDPFSLKEQKPLHFLFLGPGLEASYTKEMRMADLAIIRQLQEELGDRLAWRFRPHPSAVDRFQSELQEAKIEVQDFSTRPLNDDLSWSHAVGSAWSSLLLDVRETGRPIFWVQAEIRTLGAVDELIKDGIGIHLGLEQATERLKKSLKPEPDTQPLQISLPTDA